MTDVQHQQKQPFDDNTTRFGKLNPEDLNTTDSNEDTTLLTNIIYIYNVTTQKNNSCTLN